MKMRKVLFATILLIVSASFASAQEYEMEITPDKKIIHVSELPFPGDMPLIDFLMMIPEFADRNTDTFIERYDLKLDGKIMNEAKDAIMSNMFLREVKTIEIGSSPSDSHIKNGTSGYVNIVPIPIEKGFSGDVSVQGSLMAGVMPIVNLRYSDGKKFEMRADLDLDWNTTTKIKLEEREARAYNQYTTDSSKIESLGQIARVYAKWQISDKDVLKMWVWQNFLSNSNTSNSISTRVDDRSDLYGPGWQYSSTERHSKSAASRYLSATAIADYTRTIRTGELKANADYHFTTNFPQQKDELNMELKSVTNFTLPERKLKLETSLNSSINSNRGQQNSIFYISPFAKLTFEGKVIKANINGRYRAYSREYSADGNKTYKGWYHDWSGEANLVWQINGNNALKLKMIRNVNLPSNDLVYPEFVFDPVSNVWRKGNPELRGPVTGSVSLEYITNRTRGLNNFLFDINAEYNRQTKRIDYNVLYDTQQKINYLSPVNSFASNVTSLYMLFKYSRGPFSVTFGGNLFYDIESAKSDKLKAAYFNFKINPTLQLKKNWLLSGAFLYNSKMYQEYATLGDNSIMSIRVCKCIGRWTLFAALQDVFDCTSVDKEIRSTEVIYTTYNPYERLLVLGVSFHI